MKVVEIISEHKHIKQKQPLKSGYKRVEAIVDEGGYIHTRHIDIPINSSDK